MLSAEYARVAQLVEHDLAKVGAAGSSPVSRSLKEIGKSYLRLSCFFGMLEINRYRCGHDLTAFHLFLKSNGSFGKTML